MKNLRLTNEQLNTVNFALCDYKDKLSSMGTATRAVEEIEDLIKEINGFTVDYFEEYLKQKDMKERVIHVVKALVGDDADIVLKVILKED